jgi:hypothetical protein
VKELNELPKIEANIRINRIGSKNNQKKVPFFF